MKDINFEQYKVFYYVAANLSFSKAAKELNISQSAVSQSIKILETRLSTQLFLRHSKKIVLTKEGEALYDSVKIAFSQIISTENSLFDNNTIQKEIRISASDTISKYFLLPYIENYNKLYPNVKIKITNNVDAISLLKNLDVDIAFINHSDTSLDRSIKTVKVKEINDVFVAGPKYSYLKGKKLSLLDLHDFPILALEKSSQTRKNFDNLLEFYGLDIVPEIETQSMGLLKDLTRIGLGFSYITNLAISKTTDLFVLDINEKLSTNFIMIATVKRHRLSKSAQDFIDLF